MGIAVSTKRTPKADLSTLNKSGMEKGNATGSDFNVMDVAKSHLDIRNLVFDRPLDNTPGKLIL